jgi:transposase
MRDTDLYAQILGAKAPWFVDKVDLKVAENSVDIWLDHGPGERWACPECGKLLPCRDHVGERVWRHLDTCQFKTLLHARVPRVECPEHGVHQVLVPWAEPRSRFTLLMERWIIDVLTECSTVDGSRRLLKLTWDEVWGVMERAVRRGLSRKEARPIHYLGVDEKAFRKGHSYMTIVCDLMRSTVEHVSEERKKSSLEEYYRRLSPGQLESIRAIAMDRFHVMKYVNEAVDKVRKQEHKALMAQGDETLKGTKYLWLFRPENVPAKHQPTFDVLKASTLKVAKAWAMKENLQSLWGYMSPGWGRRFFKRWIKWIDRSGLEPMQRVGQLLSRHLENILTFCRHRITNGVAEGLNSKIMSIKRKACGYSNKGHFKTAIYFFCGGLDLYPRSV